jgi:hypothetical protein
VTWGVCSFEDFTISILKYFLYIPAFTTITKNEIFITTKIPLLHEKGEGYE